ncbi:uncharacterized protein CELE_F01G10.4 [Caenorhabditis elegans]|uniref:Uncharacterized protein n=1 Tax=Caenorhabditis elegans TaxID=6239 RepID=O17765_CAEEL|nr:Uncharacterized protein CELE_F01G10.4 [Caenorhabditis elegans]CAB02895.3 Uncharacterized protein CELE_F01G10.4 [Caenorhabditis elegans]|eukprot:NP_501874.3 Uncharacterized protein CELE_F01G10.4 [Caenorhabditis elegans]
MASFFTPSSHKWSIKIKQYVERVKNGANVEEQFNAFSDEINQEWIEKAKEYARKQEEIRARDREDSQQKISKLEKALSHMQHQNRLMKAGFRTLLLQIQNMHKEHQKYAALHGEKLIDSCGRYCSLLNDLLDRHEDVEMFDGSDESVKLEVLTILRNKSVELAKFQNEEMTEFNTEFISNLPNQSVCQNLDYIKTEIGKLNQILHEINSKIIFLTPEYWDKTVTTEIRNLKAELGETTANVLQLLESAEENHMIEIQKKLSSSQLAIAK